MTFWIRDLTTGTATARKTPEDVAWFISDNYSTDDLARDCAENLAAHLARVPEDEQEAEITQALWDLLSGNVNGVEDLLVRLFEDFDGQYTLKHAGVLVEGWGE